MKRIVFLFLSLALLFFSFVPTMYELSQKDKLVGRSFELVHNYYTDYHFYLSRIREGWEGRWTVEERYTSEVHAGSFIQFGYLLLGQLSRFIPDGSFAVPAAYHVSRFVFGFLFLTIVWWLAGKVTRSLFWRAIAFLLAATASTWPILVTIPGGFRLGGYMSWWTVMDSLQRLTFVPHLLIGQTLILFLIYSLADETIFLRKWNWIPLGFLLFILGVIFPPGLPVVGIAAGFLIVRDAAEHRIWSLKHLKDLFLWFKKYVGTRILVGFMGLPTILYFSHLLTQTPWRRLVEFDALNPTSFSLVEYAKALGPVLPFGMIFFFIAVFYGGKRVRFLTAYVASWITALIFLVISQMQSPLRMTQVGAHVPLGLLIGWGCERLLTFLLRKKKISAPLRSVLATTIILIPFSILTLAFGVMHSSWLWQKDFITQKIFAGWPVIPMRNYIVYPVTPFIEAVRKLSDIPQSSIVLSELTAGNYIPIEAGKRVFVGHDNTVDKEKKLIFVHEFFSGTMDETRAFAWIQENGITHVFVGPEEEEEGKGIDLAEIYPFLSQIYLTTSVRVYIVADSVRLSP